MKPLFFYLKALENLKIYLKFDDNTEGVVNLDHLANSSVFKWWCEADNFGKVYIDAETNTFS
jgi:hypothetical protein